MKRRLWGPYQNITKDDLNDIGLFAQESVERALALVQTPARLNGLVASASSPNTVLVTAGWMVVWDSTVGRPRMGVLSSDTTLTVSGAAGTYLVVASVSEVTLESRTVAPPPQALPNGQPNPFYDPTLTPYTQDTMKGWVVLLQLKPSTYTPGNLEAVVAQVTWNGSAITGVTQVLDLPKTTLTDESIPAAKLADDVAGDGLGRDSAGGLKVNVDNSTLEISSDTLRVKASGITTTQIQDGAVTTSKLADSSVTAQKLAPGAALSNLGYAPVNKAGDTMTGNLTLPGLTVDGDLFTYKIPNTPSSWARGFLWQDRDSGNTALAGAGLYGSSNNPANVINLYLAHGSSPWNSGLGLYITPTGNTGIGTVSPTERLEVNGNIKVTSGTTRIILGNKRAINVYVDHGGDTGTRYYYLGRVSDGSGILKVQGILGGYTPDQGRANVDLQFSYRDGFQVDGEVIGKVDRADIYVYEPLDGYIYVYLVTKTWALVNLELSAVGVAEIAYDGTFSYSAPYTSSPLYELSTDTSYALRYTGNQGASLPVSYSLGSGLVLSGTLAFAGLAYAMGPVVLIVIYPHYWTGDAGITGEGPMTFSIPETNVRNSLQLSSSNSVSLLSASITTHIMSEVSYNDHHYQLVNLYLSGGPLIVDLYRQKYSANDNKSAPHVWILGKITSII